MDKHKALIEQLSIMLEPTLFGPDAEALLDKWAGKDYDNEAAWRAEILHGMNLGIRRNMTRGFAKTILAAVYEALKEPSEEMETAARKFTRGYHDITDKEWRHQMPSDLFRLAFKAMLSASALSSPLGEE